jgi:site-specific DNA-methyltransferase (adenine-specific)
LSNSKVRLEWDGRGDCSGLNSPVLTPRTIANIYPKPVNLDSSLWCATSPGTLAAPANRMFYGDNLEVMRYLLHNGYLNRFNLIYIDPPYLSNQKYLSRIEIGEKSSSQAVYRQVFHDSGPGDLDAFLEQIFPRLQLMKALLAENGSLFVHLDWHVSHYVKVLLDEIFAPETMINEIVWCYGGGSGTRRHFHRKHDLILWYAKGADYVFNPQYRPYSPKTVERGLTKVKGDRYQLHHQGALMQDWWTDINKILSPTAYENLKFPTQKPLALLERIIKSASNPGDLVGDFFAGSATLAQVCETSGRSWVSCDHSPIAIDTGVKRLIKITARPFSLESMAASPGPGPGKLTLKPPVINYLKSGEILLHLGIADYDPGREVEPAACVYYLDFWEIDMHYDGVCFNSELQVIRTSNRIDGELPLDITTRLKKPSQPTQVAVKVHDIFGATALAIANI